MDDVCFTLHLAFEKILETLSIEVVDELSNIWDKIRFLHIAPISNSIEKLIELCSNTH